MVFDEARSVPGSLSHLVPLVRIFQFQDRMIVQLSFADFGSCYFSAGQVYRYISQLSTISCHLPFWGRNWGRKRSGWSIASWAGFRCRSPQCAVFFVLGEESKKARVVSPGHFFPNGADETRTRDLRRDRPAF